MTALLVVFDFEVPEAKMAEWLGAKIDPKKFKDWLEGNDLFDGSNNHHKTVGEVFEALESTSEKAVTSFLERSPGASSSVIACISATEEPARYVQDLATAARVAYDLGARGKAYFVPLGLPAAILVNLGKKKASIEYIENDAAFEKKQVGAKLLTMDDWLTARRADQTLTRSDFRKQEARGWLPDAPSDAEKAVHAAIASLDDSKLKAALSAKSVAAHRPEAPALAETATTPAGYKAAITAGDPAARLLAPLVLAAADLAGGEKAIRALLGTSSTPLRITAANALRPTRSPETLRAVLEAATLGRSYPILMSVVSEADAKTIAAFLEASDDLFAPARVELLAPRRGPAPPETDMKAAIERLRRAEVAAELIAQHGVKSKLPLFEKLFLDTSPATIPLKRLCIQPILALGGKKAEKTYGERMQWVSVGMGLALNQDVARRGEILGLKKSEWNKDHASYFDLGIEGLKSLIDEGFIDPAATQNDAPATSEFLEFMEAWPQATVRGYAIGPKRADYRAMVDGIDCDISAIPADRRDQFRQDLATFGGNANELETDGDQVNAWWT